MTPMCDHCGCGALTPVARLMDEHDRLAELLVVLAPHVATEEGSLSPILRESEEPADHVRLLEGEHAGLYADVDDLDDAPTGGAWRAGALRVLHDLDEHMYEEDFGLFPAALAILDGDQWDSVDRWVRDHPGAEPAPLTSR